MTSSKVRRMSSLTASGLPGPPDGPPLALTGRGALESRSRPRAWASRRAGSMVSTQVRRPASAAHSATAAPGGGLPPPPAPQHTTIRAVRASSTSGDTGPGTTAAPADRAPAERLPFAAARGPAARAPAAGVFFGGPLRPQGARYPNPGMQGPPNGRVADPGGGWAGLSTARPGRPGAGPGPGPRRGRRPRRPGTAARPGAARPARRAAP